MDEMLAAEEAAAANDLPTGTKTSGPNRQAGKTPASKKQAAQPAFTQLSKDEQQQRKSLGMIIMLWSFIGSVLIDQFVVKATVASLNQGILGWLPSITTLIVPPVVIVYVRKVYWK